MDLNWKEGNRIRITLGVPYSYMGKALDEWSHLGMHGKMTLQRAKTKGYIALTMDITMGDNEDDHAACWLGWVQKQFVNVKVHIKSLTT